MDPKKLKALMKRDKEGTSVVGPAEEMPSPVDEEDPDDGDIESEEGPDEQLAEDVAQDITDGVPDPRIAKLVADLDPDDETTPIFVDDEDLWERARQAVSHIWDETENPMIVVAHVYKKLGGTFVEEE